MFSYRMKTACLWFRYKTIGYIFDRTVFGRGSSKCQLTKINSARIVLHFRTLTKYSILILCIGLPVS